MLWLQLTNSEQTRLWVYAPHAIPTVRPDDLTYGYFTLLECLSAYEGKTTQKWALRVCATDRGCTNKCPTSWSTNTQHKRTYIRLPVESAYRHVVNSGWHSKRMYRARTRGLFSGNPRCFSVGLGEPRKVHETMTERNNSALLLKGIHFAVQNQRSCGALDTLCAKFARLRELCSE